MGATFTVGAGETLNLGSATLNVDGDLQQAGNITVLSGGVINTDTSFNKTGGSLNNSGTINVTNGNFTINSGPTSGTLTMSPTSGSTYTLDAGGDTFSALTISGTSGTVRATSAIDVNGTFTKSSTSTFDSNGQTFDSNNFSVTGGNCNLSTSTVTTLAVTISGTGYVTRTSGQWTVNGASWTNSSTQNSFAWGSSTLFFSPAPPTMTIANSTVATAAFPDTTFDNNGGTKTFRISTNNLNINGTLNVDPNVTVDRETNDQNIVVAGGLSDITNNGTIDTGPTSSAYLVNGNTGTINTTSLTPTFGWTFNDVNNASLGDTQGAYNVCVSTDGPITNIPGDCEWQSGKTVSAATTSIAYAGPALTYYTTYNYKIQLWDQLNQQGADSANLTFRPSAGTVTVSQTGGQVAGSAFAGLETVILRQRFSANDLENITLTQLTIQAIAGTPDMIEDAELNSIRLYIDSNGDGLVNDGPAFHTQGSLGSFADDGTYVLNFSGSPQTITAGNSIEILLVYVLDQNTSVSLNQFQAQLTDFVATGVTSGQALEDAIKLNGDVGGDPSIISPPNPLVSGIKTVQVPALLVTKQTGGTTLTATPILVNQTDVVVMRMNFAETSAAVTDPVDLQTITMSTSGTADESTDLASVGLYHDTDNDGVFDTGGADVQLALLGAGAITADNQNLVFDVSGAPTANRRVPDASSINIWVVYNFNTAPDDGETFNVSFVSAIGQQGASQVGSNAASASVADTITVRTGQFSASVGAQNPASQTVLVNQADLAVQQVTLQETSGIENITLTQISFTSGGTGDSSAGVLIQNTTATGGTEDGVRLYLDVNNNGTFESGTDTQLGTEQNYAGGVGTNVTFTGLSQTVTSTPLNLILVYTFVGADAATGQTFSAAVNAFQGTGATTTKTLAGTGTPASNTVTTSKGAVTLELVGNYTDATDNRAVEGVHTSILHFRMTETSGLEDVTISTLQVDNSGSANENLEISQADLFEVTSSETLPAIGDSDESQGAPADDGPITFSPGITLGKGTTKYFYISYTAQFDSSTVGGDTFIASLNLSNADIDTTVTTGLQAAKSGSITGRTLLTVRPRIEITKDPLNSAIGQDLLVVDAATAQRVVYRLLIEEKSGTNEAYIDSLNFAGNIASGDWGGTGQDFDDIALMSGGQELQVYHDANNNGSLDGGDTAITGAIDLAGSGTGLNFDFSSALITIPRGTTQRYFLVAQVEAPVALWDSDGDGNPGPQSFPVRFDLTAATATVTGQPELSDPFIIVPTGVAAEGDPMSFSRGLIDIVNFNDTLYRVIANDSNGVLLHFSFTNSTPAPVNVSFNRIDYDITSGGQHLSAIELYEDAGSENFADQTPLGSGPGGNAANFISLSDYSLAPGASASFYLTAKVNPDATPGAIIQMTIQSVSGAVSNGAGFVMTVPDISIDQALDQEMEVRNNYPDFNGGEFALIVFQNEEGGSAKIRVFSISGEVIKDFGEKNYNRTPAQVKWYGDTDNGRRVAFGVYFVQIQTSSYTKFKKIFVRKK